MIATVIALCVAIFLQFNVISQQVDLTVLAAIMLTLSLPFLIIFPIGLMLSWLPLQKAEQNSTPRILELFFQDKHIRLAGGVVVIFPICTFAIVTTLLYGHFIDRSLLIGLWVCLLGMTLDCIRYYARRGVKYLNPFSVVKMFSDNAKIAIRNNHEINLCHWIDSLSEIAIKGVQRNSSAICNLALNELEDIARSFLDASKSIAHPEQDKDVQKLGISDKVSYMMFFIYQRLDMIFHKAVHNHMETTCSHIITSLGKITVSAAKYDVTLSSAPLRFIGKSALLAQNQGFEEVPVTAICTFYEVAKIIITEVDLRYYIIKDAFLSIINGMEILAKAAFQKDKQINLTLLIQPFRDLKALFELPQVKDHQDLPIIMQNIQRVIGEFEALELVMNTLPNLSNLEEVKE